MSKLSFPSIIYHGTVLVATLLAVTCLSQINAAAAELPILHLRKTFTPPPLVSTLQDPDTAAAWYPASLTWFGLGGQTGDRNHTEVLATYDDTALYIAFLNIDRSTVLYPAETTTDITTVDSDALWIETPAGRKFYLIAALDTNYPPGPRQASGEFPGFDPQADRLGGWEHSGWHAGGMTIQQTIRIPWPTLETTAPASGSRWRANFINYNQTSTALAASTVNTQRWAPGTETQTDQWGWLTFGEPEFAAPTGVSPEATLTMIPATGFGDEVTLRAGNAADETNQWDDAAVTQSNWNDWDPTEFTIKEYLQFDLSLIPGDRKILSATLENHYRGDFNSEPSDLYLQVIRLAAPYDPATVTMLTSPLPVENGYRRLVRTSEGGGWIPFDVTDVVTRAFESGAQKASLALAGSSGDIHNGKIWDTSFGRADWYDDNRPRLRITFGKPGFPYSAPIKVGSGNYTSVATASDKNKLTNGTFRYGAVEGYANTTYWLDPGSAFVSNQNMPLMCRAGDINPITGNPAIRFKAPFAWRPIQQIATGLVGGRSYTLSAWIKGSSSGIVASLGVEFQDANGNWVADDYTVYSGSGSWERLQLTASVPLEAVAADVSVVNWDSGSDVYVLYSDVQLEEGISPTAYSETSGVYYPDHPRAASP